MRDQKLVWVIDDDQSIRFVLERSLQSADYAVRSFERADLALQELSHSEPDVIVSDVRMPGTSGMDFLGILQKDYAQKDVISIDKEKTEVPC